MHVNIQALMHHYGYFGVFFILFFEMVGIPFPAETTLTVSGIEWTQGVFKLIPLLIAASLGNIVGSMLAYAIGRFWGRPVVVRFGKYIGITNQRLDKANLAFEKYQSSVVLFGKFIAGIRVLIPYMAGINKMPFWLFSIYNAISAVVWAAVFIVLGKYIGAEWTRYHTVIHHYLIPIIIVVVVVICLLVGLKIYRRKADRRSFKVDK